MKFTVRRGDKQNDVSYTPRSKERAGLWQIALIVSAFFIIILATCLLFMSSVAAPYNKNAQVVLIILASSLFIILFLIALSIRIIVRSQRELRQQSEENEAVIEQSGKQLLRYDIKTSTVHNLGGSSTLFGQPSVMENYPESFLETGLIVPESREDYLRFFDNMRAGISTGSVNVCFRLADGSLRWHHADYKLLPDEDGKMTRSIISFYDNTELRDKELAYEIWRNELALLVDTSDYYLEANLMTGLVETTHGIGINLETFDGLDFNLHALIEWDARNNLHPEDAAKFREFFDKKRLISLYAMGIFSDSLEFRACLNGELAWNRVTVHMVRYPYIDGIKIYVVFNDISQEHQEQEQLLDKVFGDSLTGLLNREATMEQIGKYLLTEGASGTHALFMIDIDNFKEINDNFGHQAGDDVLIELSGSIRRCFRETDVVGRIGGDEFFAFMKNAHKSAVIQDKARELLNELQFVYASQNNRVDLSASIGITIYRGEQKPAKPLSLLYAEADAALYKAKAIGKNCFSFADEMDAATVVSAPATAHSGAVSLNLRDLFNHLGGGIEIYHAQEGGLPVPQYCNEFFLKLIGGLTEKEFLDIYGHDAFAGVHPEDITALNEAFHTTLEEGKQLQHTYRLEGKGGKYFWVTLTANYVKYDDGSYDIYAVYADAERLMREKAVLEAKYSAFENYRASGNDTVASFHLNLSADRYDSNTSVIPSMLEQFSAENVNSFFANICSHIDSEQIANELRETFTRENLISHFHQGQAKLSLDLPCLVERERMKWMRMTAEMVENPHTDNIEAFIFFFDIDRETRLQYMMRRLVGTDYEFLGQIDVTTERIMVFGSSTDIEAELMQSDTVDYRSYLPMVMQAMIREDYYDDCVAALALEHILAELEKTDTYICAFPTRECGDMKAGFHQWRCCYVSDRREAIMVSRTDVTDTLGGETDTLTGLFNRHGLYRHVREALKARPDTRFRLHRFDFDNFKLLNDTLGYEKGDKLLRDLGATLRRREARSGGDVIFAHLEADHFISFRPDDGPAPEALMDEISAWLETYPLDFTITSHMGVYHIEDSDMDVSAMCDRASLALKSVKHSFSQRVGYYDESLRDKLMQEQKLSSEMEAALASGQFEIYFQEQVNYENGSIIGAEALVRWNHPTRGLVSPGVFIPLFESNGFITKLDEYIWDKSCSYIRKWMDAPEKYVSIPVSVNISRIDIYNRQLVSILKDIIARHNIPSSMLRLEITETAYMQNPEQLIRTVKDLQKAGFTIEMDDFGSGYSSLNTLKDVPVDTLKLDMKFLVQCENDERGGNILSSVIRMAHWLKIPVIAEGVETKAQADYLKSLGCFYMQGYHFAHPMPPDEFEQRLTRSIKGEPNRYTDIDLTGVGVFWDPSAQTALLFNSFVGGAAIMEYRNGNAEILRANDKFYEQLETTRESYLSKQLHTLDRFQDVHREAFQGMLDEAIRTGKEAECDVQSQSHDKFGRPFWTHNRVRLLAKNSDGYLFYMATENITNRKELEEQLRIKTEALQLSIAQKGRAVCNYDILTHELTLPEEYARRHGSPTIRCDMNLFDNKVLAEDKDKLTDFYESIHRGEPNVSTLVRIARSDGVEGTGSYTWEQLDSVTLFSDNGLPVCAMITCEDVTAQKEQEAEFIRNSMIINHTGISIMDYDVLTDQMRFQSGPQDKGRKLIPNYFASFLDSDESRVHPDSKAWHKENFMRLIMSPPESGSYDYIADNWGTGYRWSRMHYVSMSDSNGKVYRIVGQISDIHKEKEAAALISRLNQEVNIGSARYRFTTTIAEQVFTLLYDSDATETTIDQVLTVLGEYYDLSRVYIFEDSEDKQFCSNTFEWCAPGVNSEKDNLQNMSYEEDMGGHYHSFFDENGIFYCPNIATLPQPSRNVLESQNIKSMLQCAIMDSGAFSGFIGFDECRDNREWSDEQVGTLMLLARVVGAFLMKQRKQEQAEFSTDFKMALDNVAGFIYIIDPDSYEIKYCNKALSTFFNHPCTGNTCYTEFTGKTEPCALCPMHIHRENGETLPVEVKRTDGTLMMAQASPMRWNGKNMFLVSSIEIRPEH